MKKLPKLNELLLYKNDLVVTRFRRNFPKYSSQAEQLFVEMLKYLWLCKQHEKDLSINPNEATLKFLPVMHEEMRIIDSMWHEFILVTLDYHEFCQRYFGEYLHHIPEMRKKIKITKKEFSRQLNLFLHYIYEQLGEKTLLFWFKEHFSQESV